FVENPEKWDDTEEESKVKETLLSLNTSRLAFVVFEHEDGRDMAIKQFQEAGGLDFAGERLL
ncbi:MAG: hypothetical protein ACKPKO_50390, partial [Candidatus Fonsibacter sp.]